MTMRFLSLLPIVLAMPLAAQTQTICGPDLSADKDPTLGEFARQHRHTPASQSRVTLTEDDLTPSLPIPPIAIQGTLSNDGEVADAYVAYVRSHTRSEADAMLHKWYDNEVQRFAGLNAEVVKLTRLLQEDQPAADSPGDEDGPNDNGRPALAALSAEQNRQLIERDRAAMARIQTELNRLKQYFDPGNKKFQWFDVNLIEQSANETSNEVDP
jgi:hypothetical protein